jgi:fibronectin type III domain protein
MSISRKRPYLLVLVGFILFAAMLAGCKGQGTSAGSASSFNSTPSPGPDPGPAPGPATPTGMVTLEWNPVINDVDGNPDNVVGYRVYLSEDPANFGSPVSDQDVTQVTIEDLQPGVIYYVAVEAYDSSGNVSDMTAPLSINS